MILAQIDLTTGSIPKTLLRFAFPMICGNLLQQLYNVADTLIVGRFLGSDALGAVGSSYTLMTFLTSILLGLCMGSGALFSVCWGQRDLARLRRQTHAAFVLIAVCTVVLNAAAFLLLDAMKTLLSVPAEVWPLMRSYLFVIFFGIGGTFLYNYYASLLRAVGNSLVPLLFLAAAAVLNIALDLVFVLVSGGAWRALRPRRCWRSGSPASARRSIPSCAVRSCGPGGRSGASRAPCCGSF